MKRRALFPLLLLTAWTLAGCSSRTAPAYTYPAWHSADRSRAIEDRANQLVARGAAPGKAIAAAEMYWDSRSSPEPVAETKQRTAQQQFVDDLEKMQRSPR